VGTIGAAPLEEIRADPQLLGYAVAAGRVVFNNNCAQCHALGGAGQGVFPTLADDDWLWGGRPEDIEHTITHGVRNGGEQARDSQMPRFGADKILTREQIGDVADYVLSLPPARRRPGQGGGGRARRGALRRELRRLPRRGRAGMPEMGAPRLNDAIALYGGERRRSWPRSSARDTA
jgi:cytochrome c oxidase cbb3-type subunit 3